MAKSRKIGGISMTAEAYENFVSLPKQEQIKQVADSLNPKSERRAKEILSRIPHGDSETNSGQPTEDNTAYAGAESSGSGRKRQRSADKES